MLARRALSCLSGVRYNGIPCVHRYIHSDYTNGRSLPNNIPKEVEHLFKSDDKEADVEKYTARWWMKKAPDSWLPYLELCRVDKPVGTYLLFFPGAWSITMASPSGGIPDPYLIGAFGLGSFLMRSAGCIVNDMWDRELDKKVERTKDRPLASGKINMTQASALLVAQSALGLGILSTLPPATWSVGAASFFFFGLYPAMKRITNFPQAWLGITFNWGVPLGWAAATGALAPSVVLPLHAAAWCWTMVYDTIYAHQDRKYDIDAGIKSTAVHWGLENTKPKLQSLAVASGALMAAAGYAAALPPAWFLMVPPLMTTHMTWQIQTVRLENEQDCLKKFKSNIILGWAVLALTGVCIAGGGGFDKELGQRKIDWEKRGYERAEDRISTTIDFDTLRTFKANQRAALEEKAVSFASVGSK